MSVTPLHPSAGALPRAAVRVTIPRVLNSEWVKFRTLRSSWYALGAAVVAMVGTALAIGSTVASRWGTLPLDDRVASGQLRGYFLAELLIGVLGVLFVTGEYGTGMIRSTFAAVPRRLSVVGAKTAVFGAIALVTMTVAAFAAFFGADAILSAQGHGLSLSDAGALRVVAGTGAYLALVGVFGVALGWIIRSTAGGIGALVAILLVLPTLLQALGSNWATTVSHYLPSNAGGAFVTSIHTAGSLAPWTGLGVFGLWVAGALAVAAVVVRRRDA